MIHRIKKTPCAADGPACFEVVAGLLQGVDNENLLHADKEIVRDATLFQNDGPLEPIVSCTVKQLPLVVENKTKRVNGRDSANSVRSARQSR